MQEADDLTTSLRDVYGLRNMSGRKSTSPPPTATTPKTPSVTGVQPNGDFNFYSTQPGGQKKLVQTPKGSDFGWMMGQMFGKVMKK